MPVVTNVSGTGRKDPRPRVTRRTDVADSGREITASQGEQSSLHGRVWTGPEGPDGDVRRTKHLLVERQKRRTSGPSRPSYSRRRKSGV